jgi:hypothetical protein
MLLGLTGVVFAGDTASAADPANTVRVHRFYNKYQNSHFYTASMAEAAHVYKNMAAVYRYEGVAFHAYAADATTGLRVHRFYNKATNTHFYTSSEAEASHVYSTMAATYAYEGIAYRVDSQYAEDGLERTALHRFYKPAQNTHFFTASGAEATHVYNTMYPAYRYEGEAYIVIKSTASTAPSSVYYPYCSNAVTAGVTPVLIGDAGYSSNLDSDNDGIGCEAN